MFMGHGDTDMRAMLMDTSGRSVGTVTFRESSNDRIVLDYDLHDMPAGMHGIHVHTTGSCASGSDAFSGAGGHLNPMSKEHGLSNPAGPHAGDMSNISVGMDGTAKGTLDTQLTESMTGAVMDADGAAVVVHAGMDDQRTNPSGSSGARISCGVMTR